MAAFPYQHHPFLLESGILPNSTIRMSGLLGEGDINASSFSYTPSGSLPHNAIDLKIHDHSRKVPVVEIQEDCGNQIGLIETQKTSSSSIVVEPVCGGDLVNQKKCAMDKKRKKRDGSAQTKDPKEVRGKKQKNCSSNLKETEDLKPKADKKNEKKISEEPQTGYIHVRARRGQATDSHSLAERVRREKISERMKLLQNLVPGCDKVTGKALMLDEIINYVQSLQNQVEFLSMKLASVNPMLYNFSVDVDDSIIKSEKLGSLTSPLPSVQQSGHPQPTVFLDTTTPFPVTNNYTLPENAVSDYFHGQRPNAFSQDHDNLWDIDGQKQSLMALLGFNMCSF